MFVGLWIGRRLGWWLSRTFLYTVPFAATVVLCLLWGGGVAYIVHALIRATQPNIVVKVIMGIGGGSYISVPNYGLINEAAIPAAAEPRHLFISTTPWIVFIVGSAVLGFFF